MLVTLTWFQCLRLCDPVIEPTFQPIQNPYSATIMTRSTGVASVMSRTVNICQETSTLMIRWWDLKNRRGEAPKMTMIVSFFFCPPHLTFSFCEILIRCDAKGPLIPKVFVRARRKARESILKRALSSAANAKTRKKWAPEKFKRDFWEKFKFCDLRTS